MLRSARVGSAMAFMNRATWRKPAAGSLELGVLEATGTDSPVAGYLLIPVALQTLFGGDAADGATGIRRSPEDRRSITAMSDSDGVRSTWPRTVAAQPRQFDPGHGRARRRHGVGDCRRGLSARCGDRLLRGDRGMSRGPRSAASARVDRSAQPVVRRAAGSRAVPRTMPHASRRDHESARRVGRRAGRGAASLRTLVGAAATTGGRRRAIQKARTAPACAASSQRPRRHTGRRANGGANRSRALRCCASPKVNRRLRKRPSAASSPRSQDPIERARLLTAFIEIMLAVDDVAAARSAAAELAAIRPPAVGSPYLHAASAYAAGAVALADGDARAAIVALRTRVGAVVRPRHALRGGACTRAHRARLPRARRRRHGNNGAEYRPRRVRDTGRAA